MHETTGTRDVTYNLISVLYHSLQAAEICVRYEKDARDEGQSEIAEFFRSVIQDNRLLADEAKEFLKKRLAESSGRVKNEHVLNKAAEDSFPSSDPPSVY